MAFLGYRASLLHFKSQNALPSLYAAIEPDKLGMTIAKAGIAEAVDKKGFNPDRMARGILKNSLQISVKSLMLNIAHETLQKEESYLLTTNLFAYSIERAKINDDKLDIAVDVASTATFSIVLTHLSCLLVNESFDFYDYIYSTESNRTEALWTATQRNLIIFGVTVSFGSIGYAIGTLIYPGYGAVILGNLAENLPYSL